MVNSDMYLDSLFGSLADPVRRDILRRLMHAQYSVSQIAADYDISLVAVSKHLKVLQKARLIMKERRGKERIVTLAPEALRDASYYLAQYEALWSYRYNALDKVLKENR